MSDFKKQIPKQYVSLEVTDRFTVSFDNFVHEKLKNPGNKLNSAMKDLEGERYKRTLQLVIEEVQKMELSQAENSDILTKISSSKSMTCEYYPCGSCQDDAAAVCCYYDAENPPICVCESC